MSHDTKEEVDDIEAFIDSLDNAMNANNEVNQSSNHNEDIRNENGSERGSLTQPKKDQEILKEHNGSVSDAGKNKKKLKKKHKKKKKKEPSDLGSIEEVEGEDDELLSDELSMINEAKTDSAANSEIVEDDNSEVVQTHKHDSRIVQSRADNIINCLPQEAFINNVCHFDATSSNRSRFLIWNIIGSVIQREESKSNSFIECFFSNISNKNKIFFSETNKINAAALNNCGLIVTTKPDEQDEDKYETEEPNKYSEILFKPLNNYSLFKEWRVKLNEYESIENLAIGVDWAAFFTDALNIYIYSLSGICKFIFSTPHTVICMNGYENILAYVYYSGPPLLGNQNLRFKLIDIANNYSELHDGPICISPYSYLTWFGFSEEGVLYSFDSDKCLRLFSFTMGKHWIPMLNLSEQNSYNFWIIGIEQGEVYGVELKDSTAYPTVYPRSVYTTYKITALGDNDLSLNSLSSIS